jgi:enoyl-[acyl-carrier-protein] reductase (NADH)
MAERGAKNIVTFSRSGTMNEQVLSLIESAKELGTTVYVKKCDVSDEDQLKQVISELKDKLPPIRGIVQSAMILEVSE